MAVDPIVGLLRQLRKAKGITQADLARAVALGVGRGKASAQSSWSRIESGQQEASLGDLRAACAYLDIEFWRLVADAEGVFLIRDDDSAPKLPNSADCDPS